jgi:hypothetical protein
LDASLRAINTHSDGLEAIAEMQIALRLPPGRAMPTPKEQIRGRRDGATFQPGRRIKALLRTKNRLPRNVPHILTT